MRAPGVVLGVVLALLAAFIVADVPGFGLGMAAGGFCGGFVGASWSIRRLRRDGTFYARRESRGADWGPR